MDRWTIKELNGMDDLEFAAAILNERRNKVTPYSPLGIKLGSAESTLKRLASVAPQVLVIQLPEGMTQQEREDLADALRDAKLEWAQEDRSVGINAMPQREIQTLTMLEEALKND